MEEAMTDPTPTPAAAPTPEQLRRPPEPYRSPVPYGTELRVLVRDGYACRRCRLAVVADGERKVVRIRDDGGDSESNLLLLCGRCATQHEEHLDILRRFEVGHNTRPPK
jgi:5-methylcytosine-specific restriction endonuclease McrA